MRTSQLCSSLAFALCSGLVAQVPHGHAIMSNFSNIAPMEGLLLVQRNGTVTPVTGLPASIRASGEINAIQLDPCDNRVWIGGISPATGRIDTLTVNGALVANVTAVGNTANSSVSGIAFDANGNAIASSGPITTTGGLFRVDRATNAVTRMVTGPTQAGTCNCVCSDPDGNLYFGVTGAPATIYQLAPGPNGDYPGPATIVGTVSPPSSSSTISGVEYAPAVGTRPARIWWTTFGAAGTAVGHITAGVTQTAGPIGGSNAPNWIDYDALNDDFWVVTGGINPDTIYQVDHAGTPTTIALVPPGGANGTPSAIDANDDRFTSVRALPRYVPGTPFKLEVCTTCPPGHIGGVVMVSPVLILLHSAMAGPDGRVYTSFPGVNIARGTPGLVVLLGVCFDPATNRLQIGAPVRWPQN